MPIAQSIEGIPLLQGDDGKRLKRLKKVRSKIIDVIDALDDVHDSSIVCSDALRVDDSDNRIQVAHTLHMHVIDVVGKQINRLNKILEKMGAIDLGDNDQPLTATVEGHLAIEIDDDDLEDAVRDAVKEVLTAKRGNDPAAGEIDGNADDSKFEGYDGVKDEQHGQ